MLASVAPTSSAPGKVIDAGPGSGSGCAAPDADRIASRALVAARSAALTRSAMPSSPLAASAPGTGAASNAS
jgi:hypothetical protein